MGTMKLSLKNADFIHPQKIDVAQLLDDGHNEVHGEVFGIIIQPVDGRRTVIIFPRKQLGEMSIRILEILTGKSRDDIGEILGEILEE